MPERVSFFITTNREDARRLYELLCPQISACLRVMLRQAIGRYDPNHHHRCASAHRQQTEGFLLRLEESEPPGSDAQQRTVVKG
ncbi:MAG TPA: hypothetical protein VMT32_17560 [Bryobacteraceae bacterium]|nr:hypothetical protein [Bryobacteraceae bacterium]